MCLKFLKQIDFIVNIINFKIENLPDSIQIEWQLNQEIYSVDKGIIYPVLYENKE